jgi:hypothetical protein
VLKQKKVVMFAQTQFMHFQGAKSSCFLQFQIKQQGSSDLILSCQDLGRPFRVELQTSPGKAAVYLERSESSGLVELQGNTLTP